MSFRFRKRTGSILAVSLMIGVVLASVLPASASRRADCSQESIGEIPLIDLGTGTYKGAEGGLYAGGLNVAPTAHQDLGVSLTSHVGPRAASGEPDAEGRIGFMSVGVSITNDDWEVFEALLSSTSGINPQLTLVDGGVSGHPIHVWLNPTDFPWGYLADQVAAAGLTKPQVQVAWIMLPGRPPPPPPFPDFQEGYRDQLKTVLAILKAEYPNLLLAYLSSHQWAGYGTGVIVEPGNGYEHGFGVKWTIEDQIEGDSTINANPALGPMVAPWIAWGPYTWADGVNPRSDGLTWVCSDFKPDGNHPTEAGSLKVAGMLLDFLSSDTTSVRWFLGEGAAPPVPITTLAVPTTTAVTTIETTTTGTSVESPSTTGARPTTTAVALPQTVAPSPSWPWMVVGGAVALLAVGLLMSRRGQ